MSDPLPLGKNLLYFRRKQIRRAAMMIKNNNIIFIALVLLVFGSVMRQFDSPSVLFASANTENISNQSKIESPLFEDKPELFEAKDASNEPLRDDLAPVNQLDVVNGANNLFAQKIYDLVGDAPIREMVPYISARDEKVAAFLIGIAKKESSFGSASPSKDGKTCYNYWGYKGEGGRGTGMGYACFASAEEAVTTVGNRIEVLVDKNRSTPAKMVDTWKCGSSCAGDPGAPGWVSTVALYFDKIVNQDI